MQYSIKKLVRYTSLMTIATGVAALPVATAMPPVEESRAIVVESAMAEETSKVHMNVSSNSNAILLQKMQAMQEELQSLRGKVEVQAHDLKMLNQQNRALYSDLDQRMTQLVKSTSSNSALASNRAPASRQTSDAVASAEVNDSEKQAYNAAYELIQTKQFSLAEIAMKTFIETFPESEYLPNAHYWLGELHLNQHQLHEAMAEFKIVHDKYPKSSKAPSAMLKLAMAYSENHDATTARTTFEKVIQVYPDTPSAKLAKANLDKLDAANAKL